MGNEEASLSEARRGHFGLADEQAVAFNKEQRVVIAGHDVAPQVHPVADEPRVRPLVVKSSDAGQIVRAVAECDAKLSWARVRNSRVQSHLERVYLSRLCVRPDDEAAAARRLALLQRHTQSGSRHKPSRSIVCYLASVGCNELAVMPTTLTTV